MMELVVVNKEYFNIFSNSSYAIIFAYFIGIYVGIIISIDNKLEIKDSDNKKQESDIIEESLQDTNEVNDKTDKNESDKNDSDNDDSDNDDSDYEPSVKEDETSSESDDEITKIEIRDTINKLYICTDVWEDYVSLKSIYKRIQILYPTITKFMIKEAMNMDPRYITGTRFNVKGYRNIMAV